MEIHDDNLHMLKLLYQRELDRGARIRASIKTKLSGGAATNEGEVFIASRDGSRDSSASSEHRVP